MSLLLLRMESEDMGWPLMVLVIQIWICCF
jgi:hypothetical protein